MRYPLEHHLLVCTGSRCDDSKLDGDRGEKIREELKDHNKKLGRKGTVRVCAVSCLDLCDYGPNLLVWPEGTVYSHLDRDSALRAYSAALGDAPPAPELELDLRKKKKKS